ncbi:MAG: 3'-5' exonuclease [Gammaproteobacteria bacterium]|nr:3'-5' exonuclease [Gammaproteobacteria bacterium]MDH3469141.1 3'-5' exonuclease [Gammaproteobacteria bacterium]
MNVLVFDIETVPDTATGRCLYDLEGLNDADTAQAMFAKRRQQTGESEFLPLHLHRIVAISAVLRNADTFKVWSLGQANSPEEEIIRRLFDGIERYTPTLVTWNGGGFDLPVLHYRSLLHSVSCPRYWDTGDDDREYRWNNYLNRFHSRHTDLMDVLSGYQLRAAASLDQIAQMLGFPGKLGMDGSAVWDKFQQGQIEEIRNYCETDVLNTYLVFLRWELIRGNFSPAAYDRECAVVRDSLSSASCPHFDIFLGAWNSAPAGRRNELSPQDVKP